MFMFLILSDKTFPIFWADAVSTANYMRNSCLAQSFSNMEGKGRLPEITYFRTFGKEAIILDKAPKNDQF